MHALPTVSLLTGEPNNLIVKLLLIPPRRLLRIGKALHPTSLHNGCLPPSPNFRYIIFRMGGALCRDKSPISLSLLEHYVYELEICVLRRRDSGVVVDVLGVEFAASVRPSSDLEANVAHHDLVRLGGGGILIVRGPEFRLT